MDEATQEEAVVTKENVGTLIVGQQVMAAIIITQLQEEGELMMAVEAAAAVDLPMWTIETTEMVEEIIEIQREFEKIKKK